MPLRGIDIRESGAILFRSLITDVGGGIVPSGNSQLRLYEFQTDGRLFQYDFATNKLVFTSGILSTPSGLMTQRKVESVSDLTGGIDTGIWTYLLPHSSGFKEGYTYLARVTNTSGTPVDQYREFQWADGVLATMVKAQEPAITQIVSGVYANALPISEVVSGVWSANTSQYSTDGTFGAEVQPVYYADIEQFYDAANNRDEYGVQWFKGIVAVTSGQLTNPNLSVYNTSTGSAVIQNKVLSYMSPTLGHVRYNSTAGEILASGEPYLAIVSGTINSSTRVWEKIIGRHDI
jgi:hypothetical protein